MKWHSPIRLAIGLGLLVPLSSLRGDEIPSAKYEDDAWYDISEWFDGNDYNPTDEAIFRWDDEKYDRSEDVGTDQDNDSDIDWTTSTYGYHKRTRDEADRWYYDYWHNDYSQWADEQGDGFYEYSYQFYDWDNDGLSDAYTSFYDSDNDGIYDAYRYISLNSSEQEQDSKTKQQAQQDQQQRRSQVMEVAGSIASTKLVQTPGNQQNLVVRLEQTDKNKPSIVDLGPADAFETEPQQGDSLSAQGPKLKIGDKHVLLAQSVEFNGKQREINRSGRELTGTIVSTKKVKIQGAEHQFAKLKTDQGKHLMVDMGPASNLDQQLSKDMKVTVQGPAVRVNDRRMIMANSFTVDGKTTKVKRRPASNQSTS